MWGRVRLGHASEILPDYQWRAYLFRIGEKALHRCSRFQSDSTEYLIFSKTATIKTMFYKTLNLIITPMCWQCYHLLI